MDGEFNNYGEGLIYTKDCQCAACIKFRKLIHPTPNELVMITTGGWCDPRRSYLESEDDFLKRVPDGILQWPEDHR